MLTWVRDITVGRTSVQFTLSLSLDRSYYPDVNVSDMITLPGLLHYGDNSELDEAVMMEVPIKSYNSLLKLQYVI